jgi:uncharacterized membrane protein YgcG
MLIRWLSALLLVLSTWTAHAQNVLFVPALSGHVIDNANVLDASQRQSLEAKLAAFEASNGSQIVLLLVPTTQPEDITSYANRVANVWKIGRKGVGDGLLVIVAKDDHLGSNRATMPEGSMRAPIVSSLWSRARPYRPRCNRRMHQEVALRTFIGKT